MLRNRRSEDKNWTKGLLAFFWIVLAGFSALYLFTLFGDPTAFGGQTAKFGHRIQQLAGLTADQASQVIEANEARDKEVAEIKATMRELSQQVSDLSARVEPGEKGTGPVASATPASPVTVKSPEPKVLASPPKKPEAAAATPVVTPPAPEKPAAKPAEAKRGGGCCRRAEAVKPEAKPAAAPPPPVTTSEPGNDDVENPEQFRQ